MNEKRMRKRRRKERERSVTMSDFGKSLPPLAVASSWLWLILLAAQFDCGGSNSVNTLADGGPSLSSSSSSSSSSGAPSAAVAVASDLG